MPPRAHSDMTVLAQTQGSPPAHRSTSGEATTSGGAPAGGAAAALGLEGELGAAIELSVRSFLQGSHSGEAGTAPAGSSAETAAEACLSHQITAPPGLSAPADGATLQPWSATRPLRLTPETTALSKAAAPRSSVSSALSPEAEGYVPDFLRVFLEADEPRTPRKRSAVTGSRPWSSEPASPGPGVASSPASSWPGAQAAKQQGNAVAGAVTNFTPPRESAQEQHREPKGSEAIAKRSTLNKEAKPWSPGMPWLPDSPTPAPPGLSAQMPVIPPWPVTGGRAKEGHVAAGDLVEAVAHFRMQTGEPHSVYQAPHPPGHFLIAERWAAEQAASASSGVALPGFLPSLVAESGTAGAPVKEDSEATFLKVLRSRPLPFGLDEEKEAHKRFQEALRCCVEGLYRDRVKPTLSEVHRRLERDYPNCCEVSAVLPLAACKADVYKIVPPSENKLPEVHLQRPPAWFKGWLHDEPFRGLTPPLWASFAAFLCEKQPTFQGGAWEAAEELVRLAPACLGRLVLGEVRCLVETAIGRKQLLGYEGHSLVTLRETAAASVPAKPRDLPAVGRELTATAVARNSARRKGTSQLAPPPQPAPPSTNSGSAAADAATGLESFASDVVSKLMAEYPEGARLAVIKEALKEFRDKKPPGRTSRDGKSVDLQESTVVFQ